jgi:hypothetical protein
MPAHVERWPALDHLGDRDTLEALHIQTQVARRVKLALTETEAEWQDVPRR